MTDLTEWEPKAVYAIPVKVTFSGYDAYMQMAHSVADYIDSVEVDETTIQAAKKDLAAARKVVSGLDRQRIDMKKSLMKEFSDFEVQVKQIAAVVDEADKRLGIKIRALEEADRQKKKEQLRKIWDDRVWAYKLNDLLDDAFERWFSPQYANKTYPISSAEKEMVKWMEQVDDCIASAALIGDDLVNEYLATLDLQAAIRAYNLRCIRADAINAAKDPDEKENAIFIIKGQKDIVLAEMLLKTNNINYIKK